MAEPEREEERGAESDDPGPADRKSYQRILGGVIAHRVTDHPAWVIALSAVLAGWLMGLLSWLVTAGKDTTSKIFIIVMVTATIGLAGLHHSIVGSVEVAAGLFAGQGISPASALLFLAVAIAGNAIGGVVFVAVIKYGHASQGR